MTAHPLLLGTFCFGLGIVLQAFLMLQGSSRSGDGKKVGLALLISLAALFPWRHEHEYTPLEHIFFSFLGFAVSFAYLFRKRLLTRIGGRLLLYWNIILVYVVLSYRWRSPLVLALLAVPTIATVINAASDLDRGFGWKVFFHAWFCTILVVIAVSGFDHGALGIFFARNGPVAAPPPLGMILSGAAFFYIVANASFVLALAPVKLSRAQSRQERKAQIHRDMELLARGYAWQREDPLRSLAVLVCLPIVLVAAGWRGLNVNAVVRVAIAAMPALAGPSGGDERTGPPPGADDDGEADPASRNVRAS